MLFMADDPERLWAAAAVRPTKSPASASVFGNRDKGVHGLESPAPQAQSAMTLAVLAVVARFVVLVG